MIKTRGRQTVAALLAVTLLAVPAAAAACPRASLPDIEDEVLCPVCGTTLNVAEAPQAERQREYIRGLIDRCYTKDEIKDALVTQFGSSVLLAGERDRGIRTTAYLVPLLLLLIASGALAFAVARWRSNKSTAATTGELEPTETETLTPDQLRKVGEDMARYQK